MNKAILVIDMPNACKDCICHVLSIGESFCWSNGKTISNIRTKPDWCPLKPMPEKYDMENTPYNLDYNEDYERGYNVCIDEILGEENEY